MSERAVIDRTTYSRAFPPRSATGSSIMSFCSRNCAGSRPGQQWRMFLITRADAVNYPLGLEHLFLAADLLRFLAAGIGAQRLARETVRIFSRGAARNRIHLEKLSG